MWKNRYVHIIDKLISEEIRQSDLDILPKEKSNQIKQLVEDYGRARRHGRSALVWIARLLMIGWGLLIIRELSAYFGILQCLLNTIGA